MYRDADENALPSVAPAGAARAPRPGTGPAKRRPRRRTPAAPAEVRTLRLDAVTYETGLNEWRHVLDEVRDGPLSMLLFTMGRQALQWASLLPEYRADCFTGHAAREWDRWMRTTAVPETLRGPLNALTPILACEPYADPAPFSAACSRVSRWALDGGMHGTAHAYGHVAYRLGPRRGMAVVALIRIRMRMGRTETIDEMARLAVRLGRTEIPVTACAAGYREIGEHYERAGDPPRAHDAYAESLRIAERFHDREGQARARAALARLSAPVPPQPPVDHTDPGAAREALRTLAASTRDPATALAAERMLRSLRSGPVSGG